MEDSKDDMMSMQIIAHSGDARSFAFRALEAAKKGDFDEAEALLKQSDKSATLAHQAQTDLLIGEANGEKHNINVLLIHSQDHLMSSMLAGELIREMVLLYKNK